MLFRTTALLALLAGPAAAQEALSTRTPTLWDFLTFDRIAQSLIQGGIVTARNYAHVTYDGVDIDVLAGQIALTGLVVEEYPEPDFPRPVCRVAVDRIVLRNAPITQVTEARLGITVSGMTVDRTCLDLEGIAALAAIGLETIEIDRANIAATYDYPSGGAVVTVDAASSGLADMQARMIFDYVGLDVGAVEYYGDPVPQVTLAEAQVSLTDAGLWERLQPILPDALRSPFTADPFVQERLTDAISSGGFLPISEAQQQFIYDAGRAAGNFVNDQGAIRIDFAPGRPVLIGPYLADEPDAVYGALEVSAGEAAAPIVAALDQADLDAARTARPEGDRVLMIETARRLIEGRGAPRNPALALDILAPLLAADDPLALEIAVDALADVAPERAYRTAIRLAAQGEAAGAALLDRLERTLPLATVLEIQLDMPGTIRPEEPRARDGRAMRQLALSVMSGIGAPRSYPAAYTAALLAVASGDLGAQTVLEEIDARAAVASPADRAVWQAMIARSTEAATDLWFEDE